MTESVRDKVENWLASAPKEISIGTPSIFRNQDSICELGKITPMLVDGFYQLDLQFRCEKWEE